MLFNGYLVIWVDSGWELVWYIVFDDEYVVVFYWNLVIYVFLEILIVEFVLVYVKYVEGDCVVVFWV